MTENIYRDETLRQGAADVDCNVDVAGTGIGTGHMGDEAWLAGVCNVPLDSAGGMAADVECLQCFYNLRTMKLDGLCPECGYSVRGTLESRPLILADRNWVKNVGTGAALVGIALLVSLVLGVLALVLQYVGIWLMTRVEPQCEIQDSRTSPRALLRLSLWLHIAGVVVSIAGIIIDAGEFDGIGLGVFVVGMLCLLAGYLLLMFCFPIYAGQIATRIPKLSLAKSCRSLVGLLTVTHVLIIPTGVLIIASASNRLSEALGYVGLFLFAIVLAGVFAGTIWMLIIALRLYSALNAIVQAKKDYLPQQTVNATQDRADF